MKKTSKKSGFTLVELMVVAVIVAILAGVAVPLMSANKKRAMATEAQAALGTVRSSLRAMYAETGDYTKGLSDTDAFAAGDSVTVLPGIGDGDLNGRYFSQECYTFQSISTTNYVLKADGTASTTEKADDVAGIVIELNTAGDFSVEGL